MNDPLVGNERGRFSSSSFFFCGRDSYLVCEYVCRDLERKASRKVKKGMGGGSNTDIIRKCFNVVIQAKDGVVRCKSGVKDKPLRDPKKDKKKKKKEII